MKMKARLRFGFACAAAAFGLPAAGGADAPMLTTWGERVTSENCWREYPRPQLVRENWTCLNGDWEYQITSVTNTPGRPTEWAGKIRVPFAIESALSGVGRQLEQDEFLWYTRTVEVKKEPGRRILLHFDGVDFMALVFIGHQEVTDVPHQGAQEPFTLDVTDFVRDGANELTVCVWDPTEGFIGSRGKQCLKPRGCFYTRCSGIWQSVWLESVPETYVADYNVVPDIDAGCVRFTFDTVGPDCDEEVEIEVFDAAGRKVAEAEEDAQRGVTLKMPAGFRLWSPEEPNLYSFRAKFAQDRFSGYFAMRKFSKGRDAKGRLRFFLNNRPYYILGTLDQGWWPDGLLTPPSEAAMEHDIRTLKSCGFNMMRKHIKVEPRRYYALCDRLGLLVLQDLPSAADMHDRIERFALDACNVRTYGFQRQELKAMIDNLRKTPSIVMWVPYNEGWSQPGQFLTHSTLDWVRRYDPSRLVSGPSGWIDYEGGYRKHGEGAWTKHLPDGECEAADTVDLHFYRGPGMPALNDRRIALLGEFGGLGHLVAGHLWSEKSGNWGYGGLKDTATREGLEKTYLGLMEKLSEYAAQGLGGSVYTQTTDVEGELNGLMTYDRKVLKFDPAVLRTAHEKVRAASSAR